MIRGSGSSDCEADGQLTTELMSEATSFGSEIMEVSVTSGVVDSVSIGIADSVSIVFGGTVFMDVRVEKASAFCSVCSLPGRVESGTEAGGTECSAEGVHLG